MKSPDFAEWLAIVVTVFLIGLAVAVDAFTFGRGEYLWNDNAPSCFRASDPTPVPCNEG